jgi:hypothetical protein
MRRTVQNAPLIAIAGGCCLISVCGILYLWLNRGRDHEWLMEHIFG